MAHDTSLAAVDLNLLLVLRALLGKRHGTRAVARVGLSQWATIHALARLRDLYADPLLVHSGRQLQLTPRAHRLYRRRCSKNTRDGEWAFLFLDTDQPHLMYCGNGRGCHDHRCSRRTAPPCNGRYRPCCFQILASHHHGAMSTGMELDTMSRNRGPITHRRSWKIRRATQKQTQR
jgi:Bacterial regulatory helix-turn-helix protein, lysR family